MHCPLQSGAAALLALACHSPPAPCPGPTDAAGVPFAGEAPPAGQPWLSAQQLAERLRSGALLPGALAAADQLDSSIERLKSAIAMQQVALSALLEQRESGMLVELATAEAAQADAYLLASPWIESVTRRAGTGRESTLATIREALCGTDAAAAHAALIALGTFGEVEFDRSTFRAPILVWTENGDPEVRVSALYALRVTGTEASDLDRVLALAKLNSPVTDGSLTYLLQLYSSGVLEGPSAAASLRLLQSGDPRTISACLRGLRGAQVSDDLEHGLLELACNGPDELRREAIYHSLSTLATKSPAVVEVLLATVTSPDIELGERALQGLAQGVSGELQVAAADALMLSLGSDATGPLATRMLEFVGACGGQRHVAQLESLAARSALPEAARAAAAQAAESLRAGS